MQFTILSGVLSLALFLGGAQSTPAPTLPLPNKVIHQFPNGTWLENLAVRSNGEILLQLLDKPELHSLDPRTPASSKLIHTFAGYTSLLGIAEISHDVFVLVIGNLSINPVVVTPSSMGVWKVNFNRNKGKAAAVPEISKLADVPEAGLLNGVTAISSAEVLIADSALGLVWKINTHTGKYEVVIQLPEMQAPAGGLGIGINGVRASKGYLYWTNSVLQSLYRVKITKSGSLVPGAQPELLGNVGAVLDDFTLDYRGAWVTAPFVNTVTLISNSGKITTVAGELGSLNVAGGTSAAFGRGRDDKEILYVATGGAQGAPVNGTVVEGGKVVKIDTRGFKI